MALIRPLWPTNVRISRPEKNARRISSPTNDVILFDKLLKS